MASKEQVARELVQAHFQVEPHLVVVWRIVSDNEALPTEPIKLLEVNEATVATGSITPFAFAPSNDVPYPTMIAEITPEEFDAAKREPARLPHGWRIERAVRFDRSSFTGR